MQFIHALIGATKSRRRFGLDTRGPGSLIVATLAVLVALALARPAAAQSAAAPTTTETATPQAATETATPQAATDTPATENEAVRKSDLPVTVDEIRGHVRFLAHEALRGRDAGSAEGAIAAAYIAAEFQKLGLEPAGDDRSFEQSFTMNAMRLSEDGESVQYLRLPVHNVVGWVRGSDEALASEYLLVGAHFDHLGVVTDGGEADGTIYPGADDNASGISGMLAIAKACATASPKLRRSVLFVAFDAEERGLQGSVHYTDEPLRPLDQLVAMINLDMIGRSRFYDRKAARFLRKMIRGLDTPGVGILGGEEAPRLLALGRDACRAEGLASYTIGDLPAFKKYLEPMVQWRDDSAPFRKRGVPTLFFSTSEHDDYHQPTDTIEKVDPTVVMSVAGAAWRTIRAVDALDDATVLRPAPAADTTDEAGKGE